MRLSYFTRLNTGILPPVRDSYNELRLNPLTNDWQKCESCIISVLPTTRLGQYLDLNGNMVHHFEIPGDHSKLIIEPVHHDHFQAG